MNIHRLSTSAVLAAERHLVETLRRGLAAAGIETGRRRYGLLEIERGIALAVSDYSADVGVWRITLGGRTPGPWPALAYPHEFSLLADEFTVECGADLVRLIRGPDFMRGPDHPSEPWRWPLFAHDPRYPRYAWSKRAAAAQQAYRLHLERSAAQ